MGRINDICHYPECDRSLVVGYEIANLVTRVRIKLFRKKLRKNGDVKKANGNPGGRMINVKCEGGP